MVWKVSYNYLVDIKSIVDAPRISKIQKIVFEFGSHDPEKINGIDILPNQHEQREVYDK